MMNWFKRYLFSLSDKYLIKVAQIWEVGTGDNYLEDQIAALYELEYKYSMVRDRPFSGLEERKNNILAGLENKLNTVLTEVKGELSDVFGKWLEGHALLSADTWAEKRIEELIDSDDVKIAYLNMISEYVRYALYGGRDHLMNDEKEYDKYFNEMLDKAKKNIRFFPYLSKLFEGGLYDYKNMLMDDLGSEGFEEFGGRWGKKFKNVDQAEDWINNLTVNKVDADSLFYSEGIDSFVSMVHNLGYEGEILKEFYKKFVFPYWVQYWKGQGIANTRKIVANIYSKLQGISSDVFWRGASYGVLTPVDSPA